MVTNSSDPPLYETQPPLGGAYQASGPYGAYPPPAGLPYGYPPPSPPSEPKKRRRTVERVLWTIAALLVVCLGLGTLVIALGGRDRIATATKGPAAVGMNQPATDGNFTFVVADVQCGLSTIGDGLLTETAQGQFCLVKVSVTNTGNDARTFDASNQTAYNAAGQRYSADGGAAIVLPDANSLMTGINPGNSISGIIVFDIPGNAEIVRVELHDSPFSGGVTVDVTS